MVKSKINVDADKRFHLRITQWSYPICDSWTSTSIRHWLLVSQPTSKEYCTVCLWEILNIILYFPVIKTVTLETANVTNCHVIATDILFLSSNHRSVQFLARKEQTRAAFAELKLLFAIIMTQIGWQLPGLLSKNKKMEEMCVIPKSAVVFHFAAVELWNY